MRNLSLVFCALFVLSATACERQAPSKKSDEASSAQSAPSSAKVVANDVAAEKKTAANLKAEPTAEGEESCGDGMDCSGGCNQWDDEAKQVLSRDTPKDAKWTTFSVEGMTCGGCERRVIANVGQIEGIVKVEADAELGQVRVATASKHKERASEAAKKIASLGYKVAN